MVSSYSDLKIRMSLPQYMEEIESGFVRAPALPLGRLNSFFFDGHHLRHPYSELSDDIVDIVPDGNVYAFGSMRPGSDLDVAVVTQNPQTGFLKKELRGSLSSKYPMIPLIGSKADAIDFTVRPINPPGDSIYDMVAKEWITFGKKRSDIADYELWVLGDGAF